MLEKETKILDIDKEIIKKTIADRGCSRSEPFLVTDSYRDSIDKHYHAQKKKVKLRVISTKPGCELIVKTKDHTTQTSKVCREESVMLSNEASAERFLTSQGLTKVFIKQKIRTQTVLGSVHFMIDEYASIPPLLEIEADSDDIIMQWITILGLTTHPRCVGGRKKLAAHYGLSVDDALMP
ncbi:MAG: hypothetical protein NZL83_02005 [Candidatus Absconditabacterales bacterium]|nr:hypothetical protein [Candidatus Absconditabacterales bacterium]